MSDKAAAPEKYIEFSIQNNRYLKKACGHAFTARLSEERIAAESRLMKKKSAMGKKSCDVKDAALQLLLKTVP